MPSPLGHALGGVVVGWPLVPRRNRTAALVIAAVAIAPDLDLVVGTHREASHSVGAALLAGAVAWGVTWIRSRPDRLRWAAVVTLAWASHVLLDALSNDTRPPIGVMAFWPFTHEYVKAAIEIFPPVSRRYWESSFWLYNLRALVVEMLILGPIAALVVRRYRPLTRPEVTKRR